MSGLKCVSSILKYSNLYYNLYDDDNDDNDDDIDDDDVFYFCHIH